MLNVHAETGHHYHMQQVWFISRAVNEPGGGDVRTLVQEGVLVEELKVGPHERVIGWPHPCRENYFVDIPTAAFILHTRCRRNMIT